MIGQTIAHYRIVEKLGEGGMGVVYRGEDTRLGRSVALKFLPEDLARDEQALQRFQREARAASAMNHPNICVVHDIGQEAGQHFIVMELLEGQTLETMARDRALPVERILELATQIADALEAAHAKGIVHRDIKPSNVFVTTRGQAKVMDFGVAKLLSRQGASSPFGATQSTLTGAGLTVGTIAYMSPEQLEGKETDFRSDLFSFGIMLYEVAAHTHPFSGASPASTVANILTAEPGPLAERNAVALPELDRIVRKCLRKNADQRYQSTRDLLVDLQNLKHDSSGERLVQPAAPDTETTSLLAAIARRFGLSSRRWWEMNHMFAVVAYPVLAYVAWYLSQLLTHRPGLWAALFGLFIVCTAITATLRLYLVVTAAFSPQALRWKSGAGRGW